jgi:hypothetical protein
METHLSSPFFVCRRAFIMVGQKPHEERDARARSMAKQVRPGGWGSVGKVGVALVVVTIAACSYMVHKPVVQKM